MPRKDPKKSGTPIDRSLHGHFIVSDRGVDPCAFVDWPHGGAMTSRLYRCHGGRAGELHLPVEDRHLRIMGNLEFWIAAGTLVSAVAAAFIAYFTYTLWDATREIRKSADSTAERQFTIMDAQRVAMTAIADAVAVNAAAAQGALEAVKEQVAIAKRLHVSQHPPVLRLIDVKIVESDAGPMSMKSSGITNDGDTDASISRTKTSDGFIHRPTQNGLSGAPVENDASLLGRTIKPRHVLTGSHRCNCESIESAYVGVSGGDASTVLMFGGFIGFIDENGQYRVLDFAREWIAAINRFSEHDCHRVISARRVCVRRRAAKAANCEPRGQRAR